MIYAFDEFEFDAERLELRQAGQPCKADVLVLRLLRALVGRPGQLVSKRELIDEVWEGRAVSENVITVAMARLRKTLGQGAGAREFVKNVHGRGYRFVQPVAERATPLASLVTPDSHVGARSPFVGRSAPLERLRAALRDASAGRGSVCLAVGEAGIGKTRLIEELLADADPGSLRVAWAHCQAGHAPPLWPFVQLLRALHETLRASADRAGTLALVESLARLLTELEGAALAVLPASSGLGKLAPGVDAEAKHRTFDSITRALTQVAQHTPCALVIDDLHWADAATLELLRFWIDRCPRTRVVFVGALRDVDAEAQPNRHLSELLGHRNCQRIALTRLVESDVQSYVRALLPDEDGALTSAVLHKSEGNPFFMVELTRVLREAERPQAERLRVPEAALSLLRQRVRALDDSARGVLSSAAVIGRSFELGLLARVCELAPSAVMESLDAAIASAAVLPVRESKTWFAFGHELLKDVLYESLAPAERRACHLRVGQLLEQRSESGTGLPASLLAHHFYSALPDSDPRQAVRYCINASEIAINGYAYSDAARALGQAREALSLLPNPSTRLSLALLLRQTLCARVCREDEFERLVRELIQLAREHGAGESLAHASLLLGPHPGFAAVTGSTAALHEALAMLPPEQAALRGALCSRLATLGPLAFDGAESSAQVEQAFQLAKASQVLLAQHVSCTARLYVKGGPDHAELAEETARELTQLCREHPQQLSVPPVLIDLNQAIRALQDGEPSRAAQALDRAEERARLIDSQELLWHAQRFRVLLRINQGETQDSAAALLGLHQRAARDAILGAPLLAVHDQVVLWGRRKELTPADWDALKLDLDDPPVRWSIKLRVLAQLGAHEAAQALLRQVTPAQVALLPCDRDYLGTLGSVARTLALLGTEREYAEVLFELLVRYPQHFCVHSSLLCEGAVPQLLGLLCQLLDRPREAMRQFELALVRSEQVGLVRCAAEARLALTLCRERAPEGIQRGS
jgi:DNA-binding winged helix-turn-helix (wHTH) protein